MPIRGIEMRATTRVGGATAAAAAAAFRFAAWAGSGVAGALGDAEVDGVADAIAVTFVDVAARWAGARPSPAAGMLASSRKIPAEKTTRDPRLMKLCSQSLRESQSAVRGSHTT